MYKDVLEFPLGKLKIFDQIDIDFLTQENPYLINASIDIKDVTLFYTLEFNNEVKLSDYEMDEEEKLIILLNIGKLFSLAKIMNFSLAPSNLAITPNLEVKVMIREKLDDSNLFVDKYKALIGSFYSKYSYQDILEAGLEILERDEFTKSIYMASTIDEILNILSEKLIALKDDKKKNYSLIKNNTVKNRKVIILCLILILSIITILFSFKIIENKKLTTNLNIETAYINNDYNAVIEKLQDKNVDDLSPEILYIGALSVINTQPLNELNKTNILNNISLTTNQDLSKYWVLIGQGKFDEAIEVAYNINDNEYLAYAYIQKIDSIKNNPNLTASEKDQLIKELEAKLKELGYTPTNSEES